VSFATLNFCVASQRVIPKASVYFVINSVRKLFGYTLVRMKVDVGTQETQTWKFYCT